MNRPPQYDLRFEFVQEIRFGPPLFRLHGVGFAIESRGSEILVSEALARLPDGRGFVVEQFLATRSDQPVATRLIMVAAPSGTVSELLPRVRGRRTPTGVTPQGHLVYRERLVDSSSETSRTLQLG